MCRLHKLNVHELVTVVVAVAATAAAIVVEIVVLVVLMLSLLLTDYAHKTTVGRGPTRGLGGKK